MKGRALDPCVVVVLLLLFLFLELFYKCFENVANDSLIRKTKTSQITFIKHNTLLLLVANRSSFHTLQAGTFSGVTIDDTGRMSRGAHLRPPRGGRAGDAARKKSTTIPSVRGFLIMPKKILFAKSVRVSFVLTA